MIELWFFRKNFSFRCEKLFLVILDILSENLSNTDFPDLRSEIQLIPSLRLGSDEKIFSIYLSISQWAYCSEAAGSEGSQKSNYSLKMRAASNAFLIDRAFRAKDRSSLEKKRFLNHPFASGLSKRI